jgi:hypothetical protein
VTEVANLLFEKCTFAQLGLKALMLQTPQNKFQPFQVLGNRSRKYHNVIQVQQQGLTLLVPKNPFHQPLKGFWCVTKAEWYLCHSKRLKGVQKAVLARSPTATGTW